MLDFLAESSRSLKFARTDCTVRIWNRLLEVRQVLWHILGCSVGYISTDSAGCESILVHPPDNLGLFAVVDVIKNLMRSCYPV